jgi:hypothetical protein
LTWDEVVFHEKGFDKIGELGMGLLQVVADGKVFEVLLKEGGYFGAVLVLAHLTWTNQSFIKFYVLCNDLN